jgi:hypothetical protein
MLFVGLLCAPRENNVVPDIRALKAAGIPNKIRPLSQKSCSSLVQILFKKLHLFTF